MKCFNNILKLKFHKSVQLYLSYLINFNNRAAIECRTLYRGADKSLDRIDNSYVKVWSISVCSADIYFASKISIQP